MWTLKAQTRTLQPMAARNQWSPSRSSLLPINMWRRLQAKPTFVWLVPLLSLYFLIIFTRDKMYVTGHLVKPSMHVAKPSKM